jgi:L-iditol 2-dehydrogenase
VPAIDQALQAVERGGTIMLFAPTMAGVFIPLSVNDLFWRRDVTMTTSYAGSPADCVQALELIRLRRLPLAEMITHCFGLKDSGEGFRLVEQADTSIKVIIRPQE